MQTELCKKLGIEYPIFAFTHCRNVVAAVTNTGGIGVLGAVGFSPKQLEIELNWIDEQVGGKPYGVDVLIPQKYQGKGETDAAKLQQQISASIPQSHRDFAKKLCDNHGVPPLPPDLKHKDRLSATEATSLPLIDVALKHDNVKLIANALGTPPAEITKKVQDSGRLIGALCGAPRHAVHHVNAGLDFIIAMGTEGGGHCGDVSSVVLWPEVVDIAGDVPVIAAGGIGTGRQIAAALAMGAQGVWTGSIWLTVTEADTPEPQKECYFEAGSRDTVRSRSVTGKPVRQLRNKWTESWDAPGNPESLPAPLQGMAIGEAQKRMMRYPDKAKGLAPAICGQIVGRMNETVTARDKLIEMVTEYVDATEHLASLIPDV